jgi:hypothetical protein
MAGGVGLLDGKGNGWGARTAINVKEEGEEGANEEELLIMTAKKRSAANTKWIRHIGEVRDVRMTQADTEEDTGS